MLYSFVLWAVVGGGCLLWGVVRLNRSWHDQARPRRLQSALRALCRRLLLPDVACWPFRHTTRQQLLVGVGLAGYLLVFTFVGITYQTWITPVSGSPGVYNTRSGLGPWSDRLGVLAFALTPLSILLASRESLLSLLTGLPHSHFLFLHRWLGYLIYLQSALHTLGWTVVEGKLYQPQPTQWREFIREKYIVWGVVAMSFCSLMIVHSTACAIRWTGYELFRKLHYLVAMLYLGACWAHWTRLSCWMISSLILWLLDRAARLLRTFYLHRMNIPHATIQLFSTSDDDVVVRLDFRHFHHPWKVGQHFYLSFPELSRWQAHPFTPCTFNATPCDALKAHQQHTYLIRVHKGVTRRLAQAALVRPSTSVLLSGPYGQPVLDADDADTNILCIAGGTGISSVLPALLLAASNTAARDRSLRLVWVVRRQTDLQWLQPELALLRQLELSIRIYVTRETTDSTESTEKTSPVENIAGHPDLHGEVTDFLSQVVRGRTRVLASGPPGMISALRQSVASQNMPGKVFRGDERPDVQLIES
ncbi:hypothetical protein ASPZODRAFT_137255 [Penicilliopsis zonata CBS 506.65]|uniref:ferric-chelate reductase (NADPH) n=1 Tax=Penicilliopsis zonata CBS 506.65 TaxID=1073090 RepID=A0A1L9S5K4_9EURO|nr:hypothetical protein ASPZODRAFT_137255 [Penicilliopsis zonata CBS 506.65]OJJ42444.1 hypothetical protein ASPZODRAFT_137255 [Penicilliopsis zonata CBS 506.65]